MFANGPLNSNLKCANQKPSAPGHQLIQERRTAHGGYSGV